MLLSGSFLLFLLLRFLEKGWLGLGRWSPCHPCDRSISFRLPSLREEWLVFVVLGFGVLDEKRLGVFSLFSVMLMDTPGFGRAAVL